MARLPRLPLRQCSGQARRPCFVSLPWQPAKGLAGRPSKDLAGKLRRDSRRPYFILAQR